MLIYMRQLFYANANIFCSLFGIGILYLNCFNLIQEKIVLEQILKFKAEGLEFGKIFRSIEQFILAVKGQNNFW